MRLLRTLAVLAAAMCLALPAAPSEAQGPEVLETVKRVEREVEELRKLDFLDEVEVRFLTRSELEDKLIEDLNEDYAPGEWERDEGLLELLGFLEKGQDFYTIMLELLTEQISGFYAPDEKYLALIAGEERVSPYGRMVLAHELTHALQDQHFHLDRPPYHDPDSSNGDADLAAASLVEGDATILMYEYTSKFMTMGEMRELQREYEGFDTDKIDKAPRYIRNSLLFPYEQGEALVQRIKRRSGLAGIDEAFARPPASTEQVMHPEKYFSGEEPLVVECPDVAGSLGEGWKLDDADVMGEFDVKELLMNEVAQADAARAAEGWGGCQYRYYTRSGGEGRLLVVDLRWDDPQEAEEFAAIFADYASRFCEAGGSFDAQRGWAHWKGAGRVAGLSVEGDRSLIVISDDEGACVLAEAAMGGGSALLEDLMEREEGASDESGKGDSDSSDARTVLVLAAVAALFILGVALMLVMFLMMRREREPSGLPHGGGFTQGGIPESPTAIGPMRIPREAADPQSAGERSPDGGPYA